MRHASHEIISFLLYDFPHFLSLFSCASNLLPPPILLQFYLFYFWSIPSSTSYYFCFLLSFCLFTHISLLFFSFSPPPTSPSYLTGINITFLQLESNWKFQLIYWTLFSDDFIIQSYKLRLKQYKYTKSKEEYFNSYPPSITLNRHLFLYIFWPFCLKFIVF